LLADIEQSVAAAAGLDRDLCDGLIVADASGTSAETEAPARLRCPARDLHFDQCPGRVVGCVGDDKLPVAIDRDLHICPLAAKLSGTGLCDQIPVVVGPDSIVIVGRPGDRQSAGARTFIETFITEVPEAEAEAVRTATIPGIFRKVDREALDGLSRVLIFQDGRALLAACIVGQAEVEIVLSAIAEETPTGL